MTETNKGTLNYDALKAARTGEPSIRRRDLYVSSTPSRDLAKDYVRTTVGKGDSRSSNLLRITAIDLNTGSTCG